MRTEGRRVGKEAGFGAVAGPGESSVIVMLTLVVFEPPAAASSRSLQSKVPSPVVELKTRLPRTNVPEVPQLGVPAVNVSSVPESVVSKLWVWAEVDSETGLSPVM